MSDESEEYRINYKKWTKAWITEQPMLREDMAAAETRRTEELAATETRYLQALDRLCALSSPRVAFERRLVHLARTRQWDISDGMIGGGSYYYGCDGEVSNTYTVGFQYGIASAGYGLEYGLERREIAFLSKDQGNFVESGQVDGGDDGTCFLQVFLHVLPDPESMTVDELKEELGRRSLSESGEKADLVARLHKLKERVVQLP
jgi:hypothetical protein